MTRKTQVGIVVAGALCSLVGGTVAYKLHAGAGAAVAEASPRPPAAMPAVLPDAEPSPAALAQFKEAFERVAGRFEFETAGDGIQAGESPFRLTSRGAEGATDDKEITDEPPAQADAPIRFFSSGATIPPFGNLERLPPVPEPVEGKKSEPRADLLLPVPAADIRVARLTPTAAGPPPDALSNAAERVAAPAAIPVPPPPCPAAQASPARPPAVRQSPRERVELFTGTHPCTLSDSKLLPLPWEVLEQLGEGGEVNGVLYVAPGEDGCLRLSSPASLERWCRECAASPPSTPGGRAWRRLQLARTERLPVGKGPAVIVPERLARLAGLCQEVVLVGAGDHFEVWDAQRWRQYVARHAPAGTPAGEELSEER